MKAIQCSSVRYPCYLILFSPTSLYYFQREMLVITYDSIKELLVSCIGVRDVEVCSYFLSKGSNTTVTLVSVFRVEGSLDDIKLVKREVFCLWIDRFILSVKVIELVK